MASLCLNMIVKNESHIIEETLENICKYFDLDYWVISDTGSTDNTIEIIENFFKSKNISGEIKQEPWQDFAYNRNKALEACEGKADYVLFFDADDLIEGELSLPPLTEDAYYFQLKDELSAIYYTRRLIIKNNKKYQWKGVIHEVIDTEYQVREINILGDYVVLSRRLGSRNFDTKKTLNDALILENAFINETDIRYKARYAFYCAQSYNAYRLNDESYIGKAIEWYKKRTEIIIPNIDFDDEIYLSYQGLGIIYEYMNDFESAKYYFNEGTYLDPDRAECWYFLARINDKIFDLQEAYRCLKQSINLPIPEGIRLFINKPIYDFWCLYELCVISWKLRNLDECYRVFKKLLPNLPSEYLLTLKQVVKSLLKLIQSDTDYNVKKIKDNLTILGHADFLDNLNVPTLCLNMIVKNEKHVIEKTLQDICKHIDLDYWVISDTGSTDNTIQIIEDFFEKQNIPGEIHEHQWQDFAYNRNKALEACVGKADFILFFDADDLIEGDFVLPLLEHDRYYLSFKDDESSQKFTRCGIVKNNQKCRWEGVLHEVVKPLEKVTEAYIGGDYSILSIHKGARNLDPKKGLNDALILEKAFEKEQDVKLLSRYAFYCAQSYRGIMHQDKKYVDKAIGWYEKRLGFINQDLLHDDESYVSYEYLGLLYWHKKDKEKAVECWKKGVELDPDRAECLYRLSHYFHNKGDLELAYEYAKNSVNIPMPGGVRIFVNSSIYTFWSLYEFCIICFKLKKLDESYAAFKKMLPYIPSQYISTLNSIIKKYKPLIENETNENIQEIKQGLERIGRPNYFTGFGFKGF